MRQLVSVIVGTMAIVILVVVGFTFRQVSQQQAELADDLQIRTALLADSFKEAIRPSYISNNTGPLQSVINKFAGRDRLLGLAIYDNKGRLAAASEGLPSDLIADTEIPQQAMDGDSAVGDFLAADAGKAYIFATPLHRDEKVIGALVVFQKADYISAAANQIWETNLLRLLVQSLLFAVALVLLLRWIVFQPIAKLAESIRAARSGKNIASQEIIKSHTFLSPITAEISKISKSLLKAQTAASEEARLRLEVLDSPWTAERLKEFIKAYLKGRQIYVVSNREPYQHFKVKSQISYIVPAGGMVTALEPVMEACGGIWLAHGGSDADRLVVDKDNKIAVPPDDPKYVLKRIWLTDAEVQGYYDRFSNEALWPLFHMAHIRPIFRKEDWLEYRKVNYKFAQSLLNEIKNVRRPVVLVQDYHLALVPEFIKNSRPDADVGLFWHIPWPSSEAFSICPWRKEILSGMLGAGVIGFHTQQYCNNFMEAVGKEIESCLDLETFAVTHKGHTSHIKPYPISVAFSNEDNGAAQEKSAILENTGIRSKYLGLGVDRMDYTKGILEKLRGVEFFLDTYSSFIGEFTFLQIASPSREGVGKYREFRDEVISEADRINKKFRTSGWQPIVLLNEHHAHDEIEPLYRAANVCIISPLSDGMNLVAKEFVAARSDNAGVLVLSRFTGAVRDLKEAIIINPYSAEQTAKAIHEALIMSPEQQSVRMKKMRASVKNNNVYHWAAEFIKSVANLG